MKQDLQSLKILGILPLLSILWCSRVSRLYDLLLVHLCHGGPLKNTGWKAHATADRFAPPRREAVAALLWKFTSPARSNVATSQRQYRPDQRADFFRNFSKS